MFDGIVLKTNKIFQQSEYDRGIESTNYLFLSVICSDIGPNDRASEQCDQMAILFFQYLSIFNNENTHNSIEKCTQRVQRFAN